MFLFRFKWNKLGAEKLKGVDLYILYLSKFFKNMHIELNGK